MPHLALPASPGTTLDDLPRWAPPCVVDGSIVTHPYVSPLDRDETGVYPTALRGGVVTDPQEIRAIRRRVEAGVAREARRRAWRRRLRLIRSAGA